MRDEGHVFGSLAGAEHCVVCYSVRNACSGSWGPNSGREKTFLLLLSEVEDSGNTKPSSLIGCATAHFLMRTPESVTSNSERLLRCSLG